MAATAFALEDSAEFERRVNMATAREVRVAMARRRVTQKWLAQVIGMSATQLSRRMNAEVAFDVVELARVAEALGTEPGELFKCRCSLTDRQATPGGRCERCGGGVSMRALPAPQTPEFNWPTEPPPLRVAVDAVSGF